MFQANLGYIMKPCLKHWTSPRSEEGQETVTGNEYQQSAVLSMCAETSK